MSGITNLSELIKSMEPVLSKECYVFASLPHFTDELFKQLKPLGTFLEKEGMTVIIEQDCADKNQISYQGVYNCITLNVHSSLDAVGLTAAFATTLTQHNISANVIAGYYHDHIFVAVKDASKAVEALNQLAQQAD